MGILGSIGISVIGEVFAKGLIRAYKGITADDPKAVTAKAPSKKSYGGKIHNPTGGFWRNCIAAAGGQEGIRNRKSVDIDR